MGRQIERAIVSAALIMTAAAMYADTGVRADHQAECETRCASLPGQSRYRCVKSCLNARRKNREPEGHGINMKYKACEQSCMDLTGLDRVRCIRICLDAGGARRESEPTPVKPQPDPCRERCSVLSGALKEKCIARCQKRNAGDLKDPLRAQ